MVEMRQVVKTQLRFGLQLPLTGQEIFFGELQILSRDRTLEGPQHKKRYLVLVLGWPGPAIIMENIVYPPASKASREVANFIARKHHRPTCVKDLSVFNQFWPQLSPDRQNRLACLLSRAVFYSFFVHFSTKKQLST